MSLEDDNTRTVEEFFTAAGRGDEEGLRALCAEDVAWIIPGDWAWAGTHRGHAGVIDFLKSGPETVEMSSSERQAIVAQEDRVIVLGTATGRVKATNRTFEDHFVFSITVRDGKLTHIREYVDTLALARASGTAAPGQS